MGLEPVKIDFLLSGNVESEGSKIEQTLNSITQAGKNALTEARKAVKQQKAVVKQIESDIKSIEQELKKTPYGKQRAAITAELNAAKSALAEDKAILSEYENKVNALSSSHSNLTTEIRLTRDALAKMEAQGLRGTPVYNAMAEKLGKLTNSMTDANTQARILADDNRGLKAVTQSVSGMAGGLTAVTGVMSMFTAENENLAKIQTRLQSLMAVTIGLQQVADAVNKDSYSRIVLVNKAKKIWAKTQSYLNVQLGVGAVASKALMVTGVGLLISGVGVLVAKLVEWDNKQKEINELQKEHAELAGKVAGAVADEKIKIETLLSVANDYNRSLEIREDAIRRIKELAPEYNGFIDEEGRLIDNADTALKNYLDTLTKVEEAKALIGQYIDLEKDIKIDKETPVPGLSYGDKGKALLMSFGSIMAGMPMTYGDAKDDIRGDKYVEKRKRIRDKEAKQEEISTKLQNLISDDKVRNSLFGSKNKGGNNGNSTTSSEKIYDHEKALQEQLQNLQQQTARIRIEQLEDGLEKELKLIQQNGDDKVAQIESQNQKIVDEYNQAHPDKPVKDLFDIDPTTAQQIADEIKVIEDNVSKEKEKARKKHEEEIDAIVLQYAENRVRIEKDYEQDIQMLRLAGREKEAQQVENERDKKISEATAAIISETEIYRLANDDKLQISAETTALMIEHIQQRINAEMQAGKISAKEGKALLDKLNATNISRTKDDHNPFEKLIKGIKEYEKAKRGLNEVRKQGANVAEIAKLESSANAALTSTTQAAGAALMGVEDILGSVVDGLDKLGVLTDEEKKDAEDVIGMVGGAADLAMGIASNDPIKIIQGSVKLLTSAFSFFDFKTKKIAKRQKKIANELGDLSRQYSKLQQEAERALGTDVYKKQREGIINLKKQIIDYHRLIELEGKKRRRKRNQESIENWKNSIAEAEMKIEETIANIRDMMTGTTTQNMASDLANALVAAFEQGEDAAVAFGNVFDDVIRNAVLNAFKLEFLEKDVDKWLNKLRYYMEDGRLDRWEKEMLEREKHNMYNRSKQHYDAISDLWGDGKAKAEQAKGIQGDIHNLTEDTGTALVGAINGMRLNVATLVKTNGRSLDIISKQLALLTEISSNTAFCKRLEEINNTLYDLKINGIKVK